MRAGTLVFPSFSKIIAKSACKFARFFYLSCVAASDDNQPTKNMSIEITNAIKTIASAHAEEQKTILCASDYPNGFPQDYVPYEIRRNAYFAALANGRRAMRMLSAASRKRIIRKAKSIMDFDFFLDPKNAGKVEELQTMLMMTH
jgi:hypothetical protein